MPLRGLTLGCIGMGAMGSAMMAGLLQKGTFRPEQIFIHDVNQKALQGLQEQYGVCPVEDSAALVQKVDIVLLAVKPMVVEGVLRPLQGSFSEGQTLISIVAGVTTDQLEKYAGDTVSVVRVMPNSAALVGASATAFCPGQHASAVDTQRTMAIFSAVGQAVEVTEQQMDAVTGLSGSGPAYMFLIIEALANAGVKLGLPKDKALLLAAQTMKGAAAMVLEDDRHPAQLKEMVSTPGGTTIEGLYVLEKAGVRGDFMDAVIAAARRSANLA